MFPLLQGLLSTVPEIVLLGGLGLMLGIALLMASLRWLLPWAQLHHLRQGPRGWMWIMAQWSWVFLWGFGLPALCMTTFALTGGALGARTLVLRHNLGERLLGPIGQQIALQLQSRHPDWGDLTQVQLNAGQIQVLLEEITPEMLDSALKRFHGPIDQAIECAAQNYFAQKSQIAAALTQQLPPKASLHDVICCASRLYLTPAFAKWTFWWVLAQAAATLPLLALVWASPWALFHFLKKGGLQFAANRRQRVLVKILGE